MSHVAEGRLRFPNGFVSVVPPRWKMHEEAERRGAPLRRSVRKACRHGARERRRPMRDRASSPGCTGSVAPSSSSFRSRLARRGRRLPRPLPSTPTGRRPDRTDASTARRRAASTAPPSCSASEARGWCSNRAPARAAARSSATPSSATPVCRNRSAAPAPACRARPKAATGARPMVERSPNAAWPHGDRVDVPRRPRMRGR